MNKKEKNLWWMIYIALIFVAGFWLAELLGFAPLQKVTAKLAIGLIYSVFLLFTFRGHKIAIGASIIIWAGIISTWAY